jgi:hypothetical protein
MLEYHVAQTVLIGITVTGAVLWLWSTLFFLKAVRATRAADSDPVERFGPSDESRPNVLRGRVKVVGDPAELSERMAATLASTGLAGQLVRIQSRSNDRISFELLGPAMVAQSGASPGRPRQAEVALIPEGRNHTVAEYTIAVPSGKAVIAMGGLFVVLGLSALVTAFVVGQVYLLPSPMLRGQVIQAVQAVHFLWPPFLFASILRRQRDAIRVSLETLIQNLPHTRPSGF